MEALLGLLILGFVLSWVITFVMKSSSVQDSSRNEDLAQVHAEFVLSDLQNAPFNTLADGIRQGVWNYPNMPTVTAAGLTALPGESIMTQCSGAGTLNVTVTVRWQDRNGEAKEKIAQTMIGG